MVKIASARREPLFHELEEVCSKKGRIEVKEQGPGDQNKGRVQLAGAGDLAAFLCFP